MSRTKKSEIAIPVVEEKAVLRKETVETGRVRVRTIVDEHLARFAHDLERDDVSIERVRIDREVTAMPQVREEGDVLIVPLVEEVIVVEKRLVVREELRIHRNRKRERVEEAVRLKRMRAEVERVPAPTQPASPADERRSTAQRIRRREPLRERGR